MGCEIIKCVGTTELTNISYASVQLICAAAITEVATKRCSNKTVLEKAFVHSSCSALVTKKFKNIPAKELLFSGIAVLQPANLSNNELLQSNFSKFFITIVEWYITMVQWP